MRSPTKSRMAGFGCARSVLTTKIASSSPYWPASIRSNFSMAVEASSSLCGHGIPFSLSALHSSAGHVHTYALPSSMSCRAMS